MTQLLRRPYCSRRPSDVLNDALRTMPDPVAEKRQKKSVRFSLETVLQQNVVDGELDELKGLTQKYGASIVNKFDSVGLPLVLRAVIEDQTKVLEYLVLQGADLTLQDEEGWTALHAAAACGDIRAAKCILRCGNPVLTNLRTTNGMRPIDLAESIEMSRLLLSADLAAFRKEFPALSSIEDPKEQQIALSKVCASNDEAIIVSTLMSMKRKEVVKYIREKEFHLGHSLLHVAACKNFAKLGLILLQNKLINTEQRDCKGWTSLHMACYCNSLDVVLLLRDYGADIQACDEDGLMPMYMTEDPLVKDILYDVSL